MLRSATLFGLLVCLAGCDQGDPTSAALEPVVDDANIAALDAPAFARLLQDSRGRVLLVNLWATWCSPCLKEIPELIRLQAAHDPADLRVLGISLDTDQPLDTVRAFRDRYFPGFFTYLSAEPEWDVLVSVVDPGWDEVLPTSFVLDRNGELSTIITGGKPYETFAAAIQPLL